MTRKGSLQGLSCLAILVILAVGLASCQTSHVAKPAPEGASLIIRDGTRVPGSTHFASMQAYGDFIVHMGGEDKTIHCDGIPGISGVDTASVVKALDNGQPQVRLRRLITHFHFDNPSIIIEQNPFKESTGILTGSKNGDAGQLLPGKATFYQYIYLTLEGRVLANREPLTMSATGVTSWPPIGSAFYSEGPTDFYDIKDLENPNVSPFATLAACKGVVRDVISMPAVASAR